MKADIKTIIHPTVVVGALGYFVDIYDLLLFGIVRVQSLRSLGIAESEFLPVGAFLINMQMGGMLLGGVFWGILGDRRGRLSVLFGSIILYSLANIANGFVTTVDQYAVVRLLAGIGLAGELGAAITLVSESLPQRVRGYGTSLVAGIGVLGAVFAAVVAESVDWRTAYFIGGGMGLMLLLLRLSVFESTIYHTAALSGIARGNFFELFTSWKRFGRYLSCIAIGVPIWYVIGILITFSPEFSRELGMSPVASAGRAILFSYIGLSIGDVASGVFSQVVGSRRAAVGLFLMLTFFFALLYFLVPNPSPEFFYGLCLAFGFSTGYWAVFVTTAAESFGTNLRATVATTVPNFVRGSVVPMTLLFQWFHTYVPLLWAGALVGVGALMIGLSATFFLSESYDKDLNYIETNG